MMGYNWHAGMSNRAVQAYEAGLLPASKMARKMRAEIPGITAEDIKEVVPSSEWHHTSKFFHRTEFFDPEMVLECREELEERITFRRRFKAIMRRLKKAGITCYRLPDGSYWKDLPKLDRWIYGREHVLQELEDLLKNGGRVPQ